MTCRNRITLKLVNWRFKLVAMLLSLVLFGSPLVATANCSLKVAMAATHYGCHCPMMMMQMHIGQTPTHQVSATPRANSCCCPVPRVPVQAIKPAINAAEKAPAQALSAQTVIAVWPVVSSLAEALPLVERPSCLSPAVLCTFLI